MHICLGVNPRELDTPELEAFVRRPEFKSITVSIDDDLSGLEHARAFAARHHVPFGLHLTSLNMSFVASSGEDRFFAAAAGLRGCGAQWLVQDVGTYSFPNRYKPPFIAAVFDEQMIRIASDKARRVEEACGIEVLLENPPVLCRAGDLTLAEVFTRFQRLGHNVAVDLAHWISYYVRTGLDPVEELRRLDFERVAEFHVSGGAVTEREDGERYYIDVHGDAKMDEALLRLYEAAMALAPRMRVVLEIFGATRIDALDRQLAPLLQRGGAVAPA